MIGRRETLRLAPKRIVWEQLVQNQLWHADIAAYTNSKALEGTHHIPTAFDYTQYQLDLPRASEDLLDTALFLMRQTASELLFASTP